MGCSGLRQRVSVPVLKFVQQGEGSPGSWSGGWALSQCWGSGQCRDPLRSDSGPRLQIRPWSPSLLCSYCLWACPCAGSSDQPRTLAPWRTCGQSSGHGCSLASSPWKRTCYINANWGADISCHKRTVQNPHTFSFWSPYPEGVWGDAGQSQECLDRFSLHLVQ